MRNPGGYFISVDPDPAKGMGQKATTESDTFTCFHCQRIVMVPPLCAANDMPGAMCWGCGGLICNECDAERQRTNTCNHIEKQLEVWEDRDRFRRELGS